ncbi:MAG TPA: polysaccharide lyase family 1 protein [Polyangia bacterium]|jgi:pectate lyase|nr:polysaccharide lyase family 1 protein [Polyangia bacterium]
MLPRVRRRPISLRRPTLVVALAAALVGPAACQDVRVYPLRDVVVCPAPAPVGYATLGAGTTGGGTGEVKVVRSADELEQAGATTGPLVIQISGMIALSGQTDITSDKTIEGTGPGSGLTGGGLRLKQAHNVIIRNLVITKAVGTDAIELQTAVNVWIDHCDLSSDLDNGKTYYDGLVDIVHASDDVTVSWTRFHDHYHSSLIGHSQDNADEDTGHLTVTFYGNLFDNSQSQLPRVRFGKVHVLNNHFRDVSLYAIASVMGANVMVERNVFQNVVLPMQTNYEDKVGGAIRAVENRFDAASGASQIGTESLWSPPYDYAGAVLQPETVAAIVDACAGVPKP